MFRFWKRDKDDILQESIRRQMRKEREKRHTEAQATEAKQLEANRIFLAWLVAIHTGPFSYQSPKIMNKLRKRTKDKEIKAALKRFREQYRDSQTEDSDNQLSERRAAAEAAFQ